ncbi:MAG: hypothetical protein V3T86_08795 [Planctomycetota bacterium]
MRILTKHYPRPDLPGRCVTLHVTFFSTPDPYFDDGGLTPELLKRRAGKRIEGGFVEMRKTLRLDGERPRLIEVEFAAAPRSSAHFTGSRSPRSCEIPISMRWMTTSSSARTFNSTAAAGPWGS